MFKILAISILIFLGTSVRLKAQNFSADQAFNFGFDASVGTTTKHSPFGYALAFDFLLKQRLSDQLSVVGSIGYIRLSTKDTSPIADYDFLPVKAAIKIFPLPVNLYFTGLTGAGFGLKKGAKTAFLFGGGVGYQLERGYDFGLKYEAYQQSKGASTYQPLNGQFALIFTYYF